MTQEATRKSSNPFSEQGVSKYPPVTPLVGQSEVYLRLEDLLEAMKEEIGSCFRAIYGDWGIGKTRLAHELVSEVCNLSRGWVVKLPGRSVERKTLLQPLVQQGILPVITTFADVLRTPEEGIDLRSALPKVVCVALAGLAQASGRDYQVRMSNDLQAKIREINPTFDFDELAYIARNQDQPMDQRAIHAFSYLQQHTTTGNLANIRKLLVIIDEVETAGEFTPANTAEERRVQEFPVEAMDIKTLFSAIKEEAGQATLPNISFLLLCSPGVRRVAYIEAIGRRVKDATLEKATGEDLRIFIQSLQDDGYFADYPGELPQAAFLAADRNFGWFSYIMHPVHRQVKESGLSGRDYEILREISGRIGKVFKPHLIDGLSVDTEFKEYLSRIVYHQMPATLQQLNIPSTAHQRLIEFIDPYGLPVVGEVFTARIDGDTFIRELLETKNYKEENAASTRLIGEGSAPFEPRDLLARFSTYEGLDPGTLLVFTGSGEFASQVRFLVPEELSERTIGTLQTIFQKHRKSSSPIMVAPTVAFLLKFNERWASAGVRAWLSDQTWEKLDRQIKELNNSLVRQRICLGTAKVLNESNLRSLSISNLSSAYVTWKVADNDRLNLTRESKLVVLYSIDTSTLIQDLTEINKTPVPVLVIFSSEDKIRDWRSEMATTHRQELNRLVLPRIISVGSREHEFLLRYSYRDEEDGFPTSEVRERGREQRREYEREWQNALSTWLEQLEKDGYLLNPLIPQSGKYLELRKAYSFLARGFTKDQITTQENGNALRQAIDNATMTMPNGSLKIFSDNNGTLHFPNVFSRILDLLSNPLRPDQLGDRLFYQRISQGGFNSPKAASTVIEQVLGLLEELGLVEKTNGQYIAVDEQRLGSLLTKAVNQIGNFGSSPSNFVKDIRELSDPFKQLAFKLRINEDQLKLLANELVSAQEQLPKLDLNAQKQVPARQEAFRNVAGVAKEIRRTVDKVFREPALTPPQIDAQTITQNLQQIAQDDEYESYCVEYRVHFLKQLQGIVETERQSRQKEIALLRAKIYSALNKNGDGTAFPTKPLEIILDAAAIDLEGQDLVLPETLRTSDLNAALKTYMMAGEMDKAFRRLYQYRYWLSSDGPTSYVNRFKRAYDQWQDVLISANDLNEDFSALSIYFDGDPDRQHWVSVDLESRYKGAFDHVNNFSDDFQADFPQPKLEDLEEEIQASQKQVADLKNEINQAINSGKNEIDQAITQTAFSALQRLTERLGQPIRVSQQMIWNEARHIDQHKKVDDLNTQCLIRGGELLGDQNWFGKYLQIFRDYQAGKNVDYIYQHYGESVLRTLSEKRAIKLEMVLNIQI